MNVRTFELLLNALRNWLFDCTRFWKKLDLRILYLRHEYLFNWLCYTIIHMIYPKAYHKRSSLYNTLQDFFFQIVSPIFPVLHFYIKW